MSAVKHQPATPLPWYFAPLSGIVRQHEEHGTKRVCSMHVRADAEADGEYLARAANAYPRLVETLHEYRKQVQHTLEARREFMLLGPDDHPHIAERDEQIRKGEAVRAGIDALLRDLGEAA